MNLADFILMVLSRLNPAPFVYGWLESRPWRLLLAGLPVLCAVAVAVALRASMNDANGEVELRHYLASAGEALRNGDEAGADLRFRRAQLMAPTDPRPKFGLATLAEKDGDHRKASTIMETLAAGNDNVAAEANRWLIAKTDVEKLDTAGRQQLIRRLERVVALDPENVDFRLLLAKLYTDAAFPENALTHLQVVAQKRPMYRLSVLQLIAATKGENAVREEAAISEKFFREKLAKEPADLDSRLLCAWSLAFQKKYREAVEMLEQGATLSDPVVLRKAISSITIGWARELRDKKEDPRKVLELTSAALKSDPSNSAALLMLTEMTRDDSAGEDALTMLKERLANGESPWLIHMALGTRLLELGQLEEGAEHLEQAVKLNPSAAIAMNNLAWTLATQEPVDLKRAENLAIRAVELAPGNPQIRETRGQIYLKQERWKEALADLELILPVYSREQQLAAQLPHLHGSLAKAYEGVGNDDMARRHRELSVAKAAKPKAP